jgi:hypothetical protein
MRLSALHTGRLPFTLRKIPDTHFSYRRSRPQNHNASGNIKLTQNSLTVNRTHHLPTFRIVSQPSTLLGSPFHTSINARGIIFGTSNVVRFKVAELNQQFWLCSVQGRQTQWDSSLWTAYYYSSPHVIYTHFTQTELTGQYTWGLGLLFQNTKEWKLLNGAEVSIDNTTATQSCFIDSPLQRAAHVNYLKEPCTSRYLKYWRGKQSGTCPGGGGGRFR